MVLDLLCCCTCSVSTFPLALILIRIRILCPPFTAVKPVLCPQPPLALAYLCLHEATLDWELRLPTPCTLVAIIILIIIIIIIIIIISFTMFTIVVIVVIVVILARLHHLHSLLPSLAVRTLETYPPPRALPTRVTSAMCSHLSNAFGVE
jgi:hypothetical protein